MSNKERGSSTVLLIVGLMVMLFMIFYIIHLYKTDRLAATGQATLVNVSPTMSTAPTATK